MPERRGRGRVMFLVKALPHCISACLLTRPVGPTLRLLRAGAPGEGGAGIWEVLLPGSGGWGLRGRGRLRSYVSLSLEEEDGAAWRLRGLEENLGVALHTCGCLSLRNFQV